MMVVRYLQMSVLAHEIIVMRKGNDTTSTPDADNSNSQCCPVKPNGQMHSYFLGG